MKALVCGGRHFSDEGFVFQSLDQIHSRTPISAIIEGGATGADALARKWAFASDIACDTYKADWTSHGKAAGPLRNQRMIDEGKPDLVIAFAGGRGTADMVRRAKAARLHVIETAPQP